jgi:hypothetical protein
MGQTESTAYYRRMKRSMDRSRREQGVIIEDDKLEALEVEEVSFNMRIPMGGFFEDHLRTCLAIVNDGHWMVVQQGRGWVIEKDNVVEVVESGG